MPIAHLPLALGLAWLAATMVPLAGAEPERLPLWGGTAPIGGGASEAGDAWITVHRPARPNGAAMIICPGGGYGMLMKGPEGHGIATWLNAHGITGVVLEYRLPRGRCEVPLLDAQRAIRTVRANAAAWGVDAGRVGIMGFSAGGHLAATAGIRFDAGDAAAADPVARQGCRPDLLILIYPVISLGAGAHQGTRDNLLGAGAPAALAERFSCEKQVTARTPPAYLAHAQDDTVVPPDHSQRFADALRAAAVPVEYLPLASGGHGLTGYQGPMWDAWQAGSLAWLAARGFIPAADAAR